MQRHVSNPLRVEHLFRVLDTLDRHGPLSLTELWILSGISSMVYYNSIKDPLLKLGLIEYRWKGRKIIASITDKGRKLLQVLREIGVDKIITDGIADVPMEEADVPDYYLDDSMETVETRPTPQGENGGNEAGEAKSSPETGPKTPAKTLNTTVNLIFNEQK